MTETTQTEEQFKQYLRETPFTKLENEAHVLTKLDLFTTEVSKELASLRKSFEGFTSIQTANVTKVMARIQLLEKNSSIDIESEQYRTDLLAALDDVQQIRPLTKDDVFTIGDTLLIDIKGHDASGTERPEISATSHQFTLGGNQTNPAIESALLGRNYENTINIQIPTNIDGKTQMCSLTVNVQAAKRSIVAEQKRKAQDDAQRQTLLHYLTVLGINITDEHRFKMSLSDLRSDVSNLLKPLLESYVELSGATPEEANTKAGTDIVGFYNELKELRATDKEIDDIIDEEITAAIEENNTLN